jgi:hypothetical protein
VTQQEEKLLEISRRKIQDPLRSHLIKFFKEDAKSAGIVLYAAAKIGRSKLLTVNSLMSYTWA